MVMESLEEKIRRVEKMAQKALDVQEIQNVMSIQGLMEAQGKYEEQLEKIWAMDLPDVSWTDNDGIWVGAEKVRRFYVDGWEEKKKEYLQSVLKLNTDLEDDMKNALIGHMKSHSNSSPIIEIAEDGKTAKGMWESPGFGSEYVEDGNIRAFWLWGRIAADFIKVDGKWKIWHYFPMVHFFSPYEKSWVEMGLNRLKCHPESMQKEGGGKLNTRYMPNKLCGPITPGFPEAPEPYKTFSETFSYGK